MKYELLAINIQNKERDVENVALIKRGNARKEYAVVKNLDVHRDMNNDDCWDWTIEYYEDSIYGMQKAIDCFRIKTEENYISRSRLEEIATKFKDVCYEIGEIEEIGESTIGESLILNAELSDYEIEFFCISKDAVEEYNTTKSVVNEFIKEV